MKKLLLVVPLVFVACASEKVWVKPGSTRETFDRDKYDCIQQSQQRVSGAYVNAYGGSASNNVITNDNIFQSCMNSRGWHFTSKDENQHRSADEGARIQEAKRVLASLQEENKALCDKEEYNSVMKKTPCNVNDSNLEQLSDGSRIDPSEKQAFMKWYGEVKAIGKRRSVAYRSAGDTVSIRLADLNDKAVREGEEAALDLYSGKVTWGEYNKGRRERAGEFQASFRAIVGK